MYAIIEESGGQRKVEQGDEILVNLMDSGGTQPGAAVTFDKVLLIGGEGSAKIGKPYLAGAKVVGEVVEPVVMGEKLQIWKFKKKQGYHRKTGHRQRYTSIRITAISG
ncbi:MAG: 50S ribosomal protein L21 [Phycisphaeraceae bacterium]|nr:50S ribosomal protein L21 [Phycisphaeraceae bacterium]MCW5753678.1 50S ribosomal protein L21 [Phycisphaeraceae bacterium]